MVPVSGQTVDFRPLPSPYYQDSKKQLCLSPKLIYSVLERSAREIAERRNRTSALNRRILPQEKLYSPLTWDAPQLIVNSFAKENILPEAAGYRERW
jgi:hypothetical protein